MFSQPEIFPGRVGISRAYFWEILIAKFIAKHELNVKIAPKYA